MSGENSHWFAEASSVGASAVSYSPSVMSSTIVRPEWLIASDQALTSALLLSVMPSSLM